MDRNTSFPITNGRRTLGFRDERSLRDAVFGSKDFVQRLKLDTTLDVHRGCVNTISWNERGSLILSGSDDKKLCFTDPFSRKVEATIPSGHRSNIFSAKFIPFSGDKQVVSCSGDGCIMFSDLNNPDMYGRNSFNCHYGTAYEIVTLPSDPNTFMSCGEDGTVRWFDLRIKTSCGKEECKDDVLINCRRAVTGICVNPIMPYQLAIGCSDSSVRIFDRRMLGTKLSGNHIGRGMQGVLCRFCPSLLQNKYSRPTSLAYSANGQDLLVSYSSDYIYLFGTNARYKEDVGEEACAAAAGPANEGQAPTNDDDEDKDEFTAGNPVKRLRLRGDWSDTGPRARPRNEQPEGERPRSTMVQRMSEMLSRWLEESSSSPRRPVHADRPGVVSSSFSTPASSAASTSGATSSTLATTSTISATTSTSEASSRYPATAAASEATSSTSTTCSSDPTASTLVATSTATTSPASETSSTISATSTVVSTVVAPSASQSTSEVTSANPTTSATQSLSAEITSSTATSTTLATVSVSQSTSSPEPATIGATELCAQQDMSIEGIPDSKLPDGIQVSRTGDSIEESDRAVAETDMTEEKLSEEMSFGVCQEETKDEGGSDSAMGDSAIMEEQGEEIDRKANIFKEQVLDEPPEEIVPAGSDSEVDPAKVQEGPMKDSQGHRTDEGQPERRDTTEDSSLGCQMNEDRGQRIEKETGEPDKKTGSQDAARTASTAESSSILQDGRKDNEDNEKKGIFALGDRREDTNPMPRLTKQDSLELSRSRRKSIVGDPPDVQALSEAKPADLPSSSSQATRRKERGKDREGDDEKDEGQKEEERRKREEERKNRSSTSSMQSVGSVSSQSSSQSMTCSESESDESLDLFGPEREKKTPHQMEAPHQPRERVRSEAEMRLRALFKTRKEEREREAEIIKNVYSPSVERIYRGHRNSRTMIKEANFWGDHYIVSGSDCGHIFIWDRYSAQLVMLLEGDKHVVNCIQPHPIDPILATSGIDYNVKLWAPLAPEPYFPENATEVMRINELMLEETRDTITVPPSFMLRMLASLNHIRGERGRSTDQQSASESSDD